jgi:hypothetical protein
LQTSRFKATRAAAACRQVQTAPSPSRLTRVPPGLAARSCKSPAMQLARRTRYSYREQETNAGCPPFISAGCANPSYPPNTMLGCPILRASCEGWDVKTARAAVSLDGDIIRLTLPPISLQHQAYPHKSVDCQNGEFSKINPESVSHLSLPKIPWLGRFIRPSLKAYADGIV